MHINPTNLGRYFVPADTKGGVCLEIGANVGNFFNLHKDHFRVIHYYEGVEATFNISQEKSKGHEHITGFKEAAHSCDGKCLDFVVHSNNESGSCSVLDESRTRMSEWTDEVVSQATSVSMETALDRLLAESGAKEVDYMKIDCECCEYEFMMDKDLSKIKYIGMELHNQLGEDKYTQLLEHIKKTHDIHGAPIYRDKSTLQSEFLCVRR